MFTCAGRTNSWPCWLAWLGSVTNVVTAIGVTHLLTSNYLVILIGAKYCAWGICRNDSRELVDEDMKDFFLFFHFEGITEHWHGKTLAMGHYQCQKTFLLWKMLRSGHTLCCGLKLIHAQFSHPFASCQAQAIQLIGRFIDVLLGDVPAANRGYLRQLSELTGCRNSAKTGRF